MTTDAAATTPWAFVCHAGEDAVFAEALATRLNADGIHAWFGGWDLRPGDPLVRTIFDEALPKSDAVVVILSAASITKPFPQAEWETAWIERLERRLRIIPVRIAQVEVPGCLKTTVWIDAFDGDGFSEERYRRVRAAIFDESLRPLLGLRPASFVAPQRADTYTIQETATLLFLLENVDNDGFVHHSVFIERMTAMDPATVEEALEVLEADSLVETQSMGSDSYPYFVRLRPSAWLQWAAPLLGVPTVADQEKIRTCLASLAHDQATIPIAQIASETGITARPSSEPQVDVVRVMMVLEDLEARGWLEFIGSGGQPYGHIDVYVTNTGRARLRRRV